MNWNFLSWPKLLLEPWKRRGPWYQENPVKRLYEELHAWREGSKVDPREVRLVMTWEFFRILATHMEKTAQMTPQAAAYARLTGKHAGIGKLLKMKMDVVRRLASGRDFEFYVLVQKPKKGDAHGKA